MGCIYQRKWKDKKTGEWVKGDTYWIKYYRNGKPYCESTHSEKEADATRLLKKREGEISQGGLPGIYYDKVRFEEIADDYLTNYKINKKKTLAKSEIYTKHLKEFFGDMRVTDISSHKEKNPQKYIEKRIADGRLNATINRELAALKFMFTLAKRAGKINQIPYVPTLVENNARKGYFEYDQFIALRAALPDYLKPVVTFAYYTGWRKSEILNLTWDRVDLKEGTIRVDDTKNKDSREVYMTDEVLKEMHNLHSKRILGCPLVYHHKGKRINDFYKVWKRTCTKIGLKGKIFHDFRRTAIRNMVRAGINESVAMKVSGHRTRSVFQRYNIVSPQDLKEAAIKQQMFVESQSFGENGMESKKIIPFRTVTETVTVNA